MMRFSVILKALASLRLTLALFLLFFIAIGLYYFVFNSANWLIAIPLLLFAVNIFSAIVVTPSFRRKVPLLCFHLGLVSILVLVAIGRLTYLKGEVEVTEDERMPLNMVNYRAGPLHQLNKNLGFTLVDYDIAYNERQFKRYSHTQVQWRDAQNKTYSYTITDLVPLNQFGYRFYSTKHKGFAPIFTWRDARTGTEQRGVIHLPAYPLHIYGQALEWIIPGTDIKVWSMLEFDEEIIVEGKESRFRTPERHHLIMRIGEQRIQLEPGDSLPLEGGTLKYQGLTKWMGFVVYYDITLMWLIAASFFSVAALGAHYWQKYSSSPWNADAA